MGDTCRLEFQSANGYVMEGSLDGSVSLHQLNYDKINILSIDSYQTLCSNQVLIVKYHLVLH